MPVKGRTFVDRLNLIDEWKRAALKESLVNTGLAKAYLEVARQVIGQAVSYPDNDLRVAIKAEQLRALHPRAKKPATVTHTDKSRVSTFNKRWKVACGHSWPAAWAFNAHVEGDGVVWEVSEKSAASAAQVQETHFRSIGVAYQIQWPSSQDKLPSVVVECLKELTIRFAEHDSHQGVVNIDSGVATGCFEYLAQAGKTADVSRLESLVSDALAVCEKLEASTGTGDASRSVCMTICVCASDSDTLRIEVKDCGRPIELTSAGHYIEFVRQLTALLQRDAANRGRGTLHEHFEAAAGTARVYLNRHAYWRLRHRFVCEAGPSSTGESVYGVWRSLKELWSMSNVSVPLPGRDQFTKKGIQAHNVEVGDAWTATATAMCCLWQAEEMFPDALILHWQGAPGREFDLMSPLIDVVRDALELNALDADVDAQIRDWVARHRRSFQLQKDQEEDTNKAVAAMTACLQALLLGSHDQLPFEDSVTWLYQLVCHMPGYNGLIIIAECPSHFDELTTRLWRRFSGVHPTHWGVNIEVSSATELPAFVDPPSEPLKDAAKRVKSDEVLRSIVIRSSWFGHDYPLYWLWVDNGANREPEDRHAALAAMFRSGVLRPAGRRAGRSEAHDGRTKQFREVRFTSPAWCAWGAMCGEAHRDEVNEFQQRFAQRFAKFAESISQQTPDVHRKLLLCEVMQACSVERIEDHNTRCTIFATLARLWSDAAARAQNSDAPRAAARRATFAIEAFLSAIKDCANGPELFAPAVSANLFRRYFETIGRCDEQFHKTGGPVAVEEVARATLTERPFKDDDACLDMVRAVWSWCICYHKVSLADEWCRLLSRWLSNDASQKPRQRVALEHGHMLCVTQFAAGEFTECLKNAERVRKECDGRGDKESNESQCMRRANSHDGRGCSMTLEIVVRDILDCWDVPREELCANVEGFLKELAKSGSLLEPATRLIRDAYLELANVIRWGWSASGTGDSVANVADARANSERPATLAEMSDGDVPDKDVCCRLEKWVALERIVNYCRVIGDIWSRYMAPNQRDLLEIDPCDRANVADALRQLADAESKWKFLEYTSLWATFRAGAAFLLGNTSAVEAALEKANCRMIDQGECAFVPVNLRMRAQIAQSLGYSNEAQFLENAAQEFAAMQKRGATNSEMTEYLKQQVTASSAVHARAVALRADDSTGNRGQQPRRSAEQSPDVI